MKISIAASLLILAIGVSLGWHDRQQLAAIRATREQLVAEVTLLGVSSEPAHLTKRKRPSPATPVMLSNEELIELAKHPNLMLLYDSLTALDPAGLKALLTEAATNPELDERTRMLVDHCCTTVLAHDHPQAALKIFTSNPELFAQGDRGRSLVLTALVCLARNDLSAALDWVRKNPQHYAEEAKGEFISAVAEQDAPLAFRLVRELDFKISNYAVGQILSSQNTLEAKSSAFAGLREYLTTIQDVKVRDQVAESAIGGLAGSLRRESFGSASRWISEQNLTPPELGALIGELDISTSNGETGRWIEWLRQPGRAADPRVKHLIYQWTCADYPAAMQWAVSQPPGKDRDQVIKTIHGAWPKQDPAGKEAFAKEHGIQ